MPSHFKSRASGKSRASRSARTHTSAGPAAGGGRPGRGGRAAAVAVAALLAATAAAYVGGALYFGSHFLPGTTLDGTDVSLLSDTEVADAKSQAYDGYQLRVTGDGLDLTIGAADIDLTCDGRAYADSAISQTNPWAWPLEALRTRELTATAGALYDEDKLRALIQPQVDASASVASELGGSGISFDAAQGAYVLDDRVVASHLDVDAALEEIGRAIAERSGSVTLGDDQLTGQGSFTDALGQANALVAATQTLTLGGTEAYALDAQKISGWVRVGDDLSVSLDTDAISEFCHGELTELLDTRGKQRTYTRPDGATFTVADTNPNYSASTYGWVIDGDACASAIASAIESGQAGTVELPCLQSAAKVAPGGQDWPDRYIDVNLTEQHAVFYDNGSVIWEADITSGQPNLNQETPTGVWTITSHKSRATDGDITLRGPKDPETGEYKWEAAVDFWMGVVGQLVGFHNAPLQHTFGGNVYTYMGSHGCMRMSYESAQALYEVAKVGDVVVIHK